MTDRDQRWPEVKWLVEERMADQAMSQAELVEASGVSAFTVRRVMNGEPGNYRADRLRKISAALGIGARGIERVLDGELTAAELVAESRHPDPSPPAAPMQIAALTGLTPEEQKIALAAVERHRKKQR